MKKIFTIMATLVVALGFVSCNKENTETPDNGGGEAKAPVADFEFKADGLTVTFTNKSTDATSYKWEFGDEETSKDANPVHEYAVAGEYTVKLTAANAAGASSKKEVKVNVAGKVQAFFSTSTPEGRAAEFGKAVQFDATASANAASVVWDFGDGETSTEFKPLHVFPSFGKFAVKATVTGVAGDTDVFSKDVEVVKATEMIKGGSMEADDAQYWTVAPLWGYDKGQYEPVEGVYAYAPEFGHTAVNIGKGGCYKFISNPLGWDFSNKGCVYQSFEVRAGDVFEVDCLVKWGEESQDNGHFSIRLTYGEWAEEGALLYYFNNWWGVHDVDESIPGDVRYTVWLPAFEGGNIAACQAAMADYGAGAVDGELTEGGKVRFTAIKDGTVNLAFFVNQVWGYAFGEGRDIYLDEVSCQAVID